MVREEHSLKSCESRAALLAAEPFSVRSFPGETRLGENLNCSARKDALCFSCCCCWSKWWTFWKPLLVLLVPFITCWWLTSSRWSLLLFEIDVGGPCGGEVFDAGDVRGPPEMHFYLIYFLDNFKNMEFGRRGFIDIIQSIAFMYRNCHNDNQNGRSRKNVIFPPIEPRDSWSTNGPAGYYFWGGGFY